MKLIDNKINDIKIDDIIKLKSGTKDEDDIGLAVR